MRTLILPFALAAGLCAQAPAPQGNPDRAAHRQEKMAKALGLNEAQRAQIKTIRAKHRDAIQSKHAAVRGARETLTQAMKDPKTPEAELRRLHAQAADLRFDLLLELRSLRSEVRAILTPEQREKAAELRGQAQERFRILRGLSAPGQAG